MAVKEGKKPNQLIDEKSLYLLQHAYNPVDWFPWEDEALAKAKQEDKPIFVSIGYSACHWCHVMERESFEDQEVADVLNQNYVAIKVDREERPDLDHTYMKVCQALTGQGGWPLHVILTPDLKPFFAGTYFPKEDRFGRSGLITILHKIQELWQTERDRATENAEKIVSQLAPFFDPVDPAKADPMVFDEAFEQFARQYDQVYGGFGEAPKFPRPHDLLFILRYYKLHRDPEALEMVTHTLDRMRRGGIYDHLGSGFSRYSVDREWLVPHFEKMLYDQALLALSYIEAYQATQLPSMRQTAEEVFDYVSCVLTAPTGVFYAAEDADSEGIEGKFYVWTKQEVFEVLGEAEGEIFCECFDVTEQGNFEGTNVLNQIHVALPAIAEDLGLSLAELEEKLFEMKQKLHAEREKRVHPLKDDKILTAWNALMIVALARGARAFDNKEYLASAERASEWIWNHLRDESGRLYARYRDGERAHLAYLDDYAFLIWSLMELYEVTFDSTYLDRAMELTFEQKRLFWDEERGGFFFTGVDQDSALTRLKELYDGAIPSGNSVSAYNLIRLGKCTSDPELLELAQAQIEAFAGVVQESPIANPFFLLAMQFAMRPTKEIVIVGDAQAVDTQLKIKLIQQAYLPEAVILLQDPKHPVGAKELQMKPSSNPQEALVYICENFTCQQPIATLEGLRKALV